ncbi:lysylphosphatidylglycerol synthase domain-containing protein [Algibacter miyuki]|uniref:lysylphosphatidylglycerol synthase domain-containing protein n=1 Tax=Algibacter miyuki TaxID=1306933 RepID=UPI0025B31303|nr:lysylphosphatidylglycerol synthase domain-containing protein [Algibacter miyuki]MDN3664573.1 lysylphosphatidylglycerol synthase domain-containing protein [Algibacter miyuki]
MRPHKTKQFFFVLLKLSIVLGAFYFIYLKLAHNNQLSFSSFIAFLNKNALFSLKSIVFLLILTCFNWFFEILKWQNLISTLKTISFNQALKQTLGSLTASIITPNRIGEYGAKAMYFTPNLRKRVMLVNLIGNLQQMSITSIFGVIGLFFFINKYQLETHYFRLLIILVVGLIATGLFIFGLEKYNIKGFSIQKLKTFVQHFPKHQLFIGFTLSLARYLIFSFQFYYLFQIFHIELNYFNSMLGITSMYLLTSIIPSIFILDVVVKGSVAVYLFAFLGVNQLVILSIITIMWIFNFVLPSLIGSYFVLQFKIPKTET